MELTCGFMSIFGLGQYDDEDILWVRYHEWENPWNDQTLSQWRNCTVNKDGEKNSFLKWIEDYFSYWKWVVIVD